MRTFYEQLNIQVATMIKLKPQKLPFNSPDPPGNSKVPIILYMSKRMEHDTNVQYLRSVTSIIVVQWNPSCSNKIDSERYIRMGISITC